MVLPVVSILIPTYNRHRSLQHCLAACKRLHYPSDLVEVIVVDDGSTPPVEVGEGVRVFQQAQRGPAAARNLAIENATGELLVFTDDDCEPEPEWLTELVNVYSQDQTALVGGVTVNGLPENPFAAASQCLVDYAYRYFEANDQGLRFFTSNNFGGASAIMRLLGGFDESFPLPAAEDRDLCERWGNLSLAPTAIIIHRHGLSLGSYWRQHFRYGRGANILFRRRGQRGSNRRSHSATRT